jgi:hypothetical protein
MSKHPRTAHLHRRSKMEKATKVYPPVEDDIVEVNMTGLYTTVGILSVATIGLTAATSYLWRKTKRNQEYLEALAEYVSRLVDETECGRVAYQAIVDDSAEEDAPVDWSDELGPYPEGESKPRRSLVTDQD